jgi:hypothetical protein
MSATITDDELFFMVRSLLPTAILRTVRGLLSFHTIRLEAARNRGEGLFAAFAAGKYRYSVAGDTPSAARLSKRRPPGSDLRWRAARVQARSRTNADIS